MSAPMTMEERLQRRRRALAAALVVAGATTLATGIAHALGGGVAPDALLLAAGLVVTLLVLAPVLGSRRSLARQSVAVGIAQVVQHALYSLHGGSLPGAAHPSAAVGHAHHAADVALPGSAVLHAHASMPLAHLAAGALTLALLRLVPRALAAMLEAMSLRRAVAALRWAGMPARRRASVTAARRAHRRTLDVLHAALVTRGPPLALV